MTTIAFLPPSSRWTRFRLSAPAFITATPGLARSGQRDHGHVRVRDEPLTDRAAAPVDDVDDAGRHPGLDQQLDEALAEGGCVASPA